MALVTSDLLAALLTGYQVIFREALDAAGVDVPFEKISTRIESISDKESYNWLGALPAMSEWTDQRKRYALLPYDYTLTNKHYEATVEVDRDTIEDDKFGMIAPRIQGLARRAVKHFAEKVFSQLDDGETLLAYDGTAFFDTTRTIGGSGTINNFLGIACSGTAAEVRYGLQQASLYMRKFKDDRGVLMNLMPDTIVCGPAMEWLVKEAFIPAVAGTVRPEKELIDNIIVSPWINEDDLNWYVLCTKADVKPVVFQMRKDPEFISLDDPKSSHVFQNRTFLYGVDDRFEVGYGDPRTCVKLEDT